MGMLMLFTLWVGRGRDEVSGVVGLSGGAEEEV